MCDVRGPLLMCSVLDDFLLWLNIAGSNYSMFQPIGPCQLYNKCGYCTQCMLIYTPDYSVTVSVCVCIGWRASGRQTHPP